MRPPIYLVPLIVLLITTLSCNLGFTNLPGNTATPLVYADTFFSGRAYIDSNGNGELDPSDPPLENACFFVAGFSDYTDASGLASITIPGKWTHPVTALMTAPEGSGYTLIGPSEVILQAGKLTSAAFLFAPPEGISAKIPSETPTVTPLPTPTPEISVSSRPRRVMRDLTYCTTEDGVELKMDMYFPAGMTTPAPVVVYVHGGAWVSGDKRDGAGVLFIPTLLKRGYVVVGINYRLAPKYKFPAQIVDVKCAIRYLRAKAQEYQLDADHIGAMGGSAGGHLVSLLGLTDVSAGWDIGQYTEYSSAVQAVVDMFGPSDLPTMRERPTHPINQRVFGVTRSDDPLLKTYSPVTYVSAGDPPFLILQGERDSIVPPYQSQLLYEKLVAAGVPATLVMVKNAGHSFTPVGGWLSPSMKQLQEMVGDFFDQYLK